MCRQRMSQWAGWEFCVGRARFIEKNKPDAQRKYCWDSQAEYFCDCGTEGENEWHSNGSQERDYWITGTQNWETGILNRGRIVDFTI